MANKSIDIIISSVFHNKGIDAARNALDSLKDKTKGVGGAFSKLAHSIGGMTGSIVGSLTAIVSGGILGAVTVGIAGIVSLWNKHKEAVDNNTKAIRDNYTAAIKRFSAEVKSGLDAEIKGINDVCKAKDAEIARNEKLLQSIIDLKKAKGEISSEEATRQSLKLKTDSAASRAENEILAGNDIKAVQEKYLKRMDEELSSMGEQLASYERQATEKIAKQRAKFETEADIEITNNRSGDNLPPSFKAEAIRRRADKKMAEWMNDNGKDLYDEEIKALVEGINQTYKARGELEKALKKTADDIEAANIKVVTEKNIAAAQAVEQANKEYAASIKEASKSVKTSPDVQRRIVDTMTRAQTEFDKAFAMYRSEDKGAAQIAEERDYAADYKQLKKDATRYGSKWRIDELSAIIAAGDTKGQQAKLEEWRKSKSFTPEIESMVRAAAADNTKTTAEDELRKISKNTEDLGSKLEELLAMK